jgi:hypothetical protein
MMPVSLETTWIGPKPLIYAIQVVSNFSVLHFSVEILTRWSGICFIKQLGDARKTLAACCRIVSSNQNKEDGDREHFDNQR